MAIRSISDYELTLLTRRLAEIKIGKRTDVERESFLTWVRDLHGYHNMLRAKARYATTGFGEYDTAYIAHLTGIVNIAEAELAAEEAAPGFDGMPLHGPHPTAA